MASKETPARSLADFEVGKILNKGTHGAVYRAREKKSGQLVALKMTFSKHETKALAEHRAWTLLPPHPHLVKMHAHWTDAVAKRHWFSFELGGKDLKDLTLEDDGFPAKWHEDKVAAIVWQVAAALHHVHAHGLVHGDVKPENILSFAPGVWKLCDFGLSLSVADDEDGSWHGTVDYMAPEVFGTAPVKPDPASDMWSLGIVLFELLTGDTPWTEAPDTVQGVSDHILTRPIVYPDSIGPRFRDLLQHLLVADAPGRWTAPQVLEHLAAARAPA